MVGAVRAASDGIQLVSLEKMELSSGEFLLFSVKVMSVLMALTLLPLRWRASARWRVAWLSAFLSRCFGFFTSSVSDWIA